MHLVKIPPAFRIQTYFLVRWDEISGFAQEPLMFERSLEQVMRKIGSWPWEQCHPLRLGRDRQGERHLGAPHWG